MDRPTDKRLALRTGGVWYDANDRILGFSQAEAFFVDQIEFALTNASQLKGQSVAHSCELLDKYASKLAAILREHLPTEMHNEAFGAAFMFFSGAWGIGADTGQKIGDVDRMAGVRSYKKASIKDNVERILSDELKRGTPRNQLVAVIEARLEKLKIGFTKRRVQQLVAAHKNEIL